MCIQHGPMPTDPSLPPPELLREQAAWLAAARSRALRRARIASRRRILDLACGPGMVTGELAVRAATDAMVVGLDRSREALGAVAGSVREPPQALGTCAKVQPVHAAANALPLRNAAFDLAFCQFALLWLDAARGIAELARIVAPGGVVVAIEPDYGGLIEYPPEIAARDLWRNGLTRAGADPEVGRKLPGLFAGAGFRVHVELLDRLAPPSASRFTMLRGLPLTSDELQQLTAIEEAAASSPEPTVAHLPLFVLTAERR